MKYLQVIYLLFLLFAFSSCSIESGDELTHVASLNDEAPIFERQEAPGSLIKGVGSKIQAGAANLIQGVEHFVVGVLGAINNVDVQSQIQGIVPEHEKTTPEDGEEEETTPAPPPPTTTLRTTRRPTRRARTTLPTEETTERVIYSKKPGYKIRPKTTSPNPEDSEAQSEAPGELQTTSKVATSAPIIPQQQQQQPAVPQIQYVVIPNYHPIYQPQYQQPIYQPIPPQYQQIPNQQQPIRTDPNGQQPAILAQPAVNPIVNQQPAVLTQPIGAVNPTVNEQIKSVVNQQQQPLYPSLPQANPIILVLPQQQQQQPNPVIVPAVQPLLQQQQEIATTTPAPPPTTATAVPTTTAEPTQPPSKLQQFSLNRKPLVPRTTKPVVSNFRLPLGTILRPKEPSYPNKGPTSQYNESLKNQLLVNQRPGVIINRFPQQPLVGSNQVVPGSNAGGGSEVAPGEETGEVVTETAVTEETEIPEESENTDPDNEAGRA